MSPASQNPHGPPAGRRPVVVILQPMFLPWPGHFEQVRLADVFVHLDDVQLPQGRSFVKRVQIKTPRGPRWLTAPTRKDDHRKPIRDVRLQPGRDWRDQHLRLLEENYRHAPCYQEMRSLAEDIYGLETDWLAEMNIHATERIARYFELPARFDRSSRMGVDAASTHRLVELMDRVGGRTYLTGHGARNYLDHEAFEARNLTVEYIDYLRRPYPQLHGPFDPHVSILDLIANAGQAGREALVSPSVPWREFLAREERVA